MIIPPPPDNTAHPPPSLRIGTSARLQLLLLYYLALVAAFAIYNLRTVRGIGGLEFIRTGLILMEVSGLIGIDIPRVYRVDTFISSAHTLPMPELEGIPLSDPLIVPAIGTETG